MLFLNYLSIEHWPEHRWTIAPWHVREHARYGVYLFRQGQLVAQGLHVKEHIRLTISFVTFFGLKPRVVRIARCSGVSFDDVAHRATK